jgi:hypothetical protein
VKEIWTWAQILEYKAKDLKTKTWYIIFDENRLVSNINRASIITFYSRKLKQGDYHEKNA